MEFCHNLFRIAIAVYFEKMPDKIRHYHQDHHASVAEAKIIAKYYLQRSDQAKTVRTQQDLKDFIKSVEELKQQVSHYNHESYKYRWSTGLDKEVLDKLNQRLLRK